MNILKKMFDTEYLSKMAEYNRNDEDEKLNTLMYSSDSTIQSIENDIMTGKGIETPVDFTVYNGKGLLSEGCHRVAAAVNTNLENVPVRIILKGSLTGDLKDRESKFKNL